MKFHQIQQITSIPSLWQSQQIKREQIKLSDLAQFTLLKMPNENDNKQAIEYRKSQQQKLRKSKLRPKLDIMTKSQMLQSYLEIRKSFSSKCLQKSRSSSFFQKQSAVSTLLSLDQSPKQMQQQKEIVKQKDIDNSINSKGSTPQQRKTTNLFFTPPLRQLSFANSLDLLRPETPLNFRCLVQEVSVKKQKINIKAIIQQIIHKLVVLHRLQIKKIETKIWSNKPFEKNKSYEFIKACKLGNLKVVKEMLIKDRFLTFSFDYIHQTGLHWAIKRSHFKIAQQIIKVGCDVDAQDLIGRPPLYFAIEAKQIDFVKLLLENNATPWTTQRITYSKLCNDHISIMLLLNKARKIHVIYKMVDAQKRMQIKQKILHGLFDT